MLHEIKPIVKKIYPTTILYPRTIKVEEIIKKSENEGLEIANIIENPIEALKKAIKDATEDDIILITGSFYLLGDILQNPPWGKRCSGYVPRQRGQRLSAPGLRESWRQYNAI